MRSNYRRLTVLLVLVVVFFLSVSIGLDRIDAASKVLRIGMGTIPALPDPHLDSTGIVISVYNEMYDTLVTVDEEGNLIPELAESWKMMDSTTWQFKLKKGVRFHNGEEFIASDVKFTLERMLDPASKARWEERVRGIESIEVVDKYTVNIHTKSPMPTLISSGLTVVFMIPERYFKQVGAAGFAEKPVGTGRFKFKEWRRDTYFAVESNDNYWGGRPKLDGVIFRQYPEVSTMIAALEAGEIDVAYPISPDYVENLKSRGFNVEWTPIGYSLLVFMRPEGALADKRVRQAFSYAVDTRAIFEKLLLGYGRLLRAQIPGPDGFGHNPDLEPYPYDPEKAKKLLEEAGYPAGRGLEVTYQGSIGRYIKDKEIAEAVVGYLQRLGVKVNMEFLEGATFVFRHRDGKLGPMFLMGWQYLPAMDSHLSYGAFVSTDNRRHLLNKTFDELYARETQEVDPEKRRRLLQEIAMLMREEAPVIFLAQAPAIVAMRKSVKNLTVGPDYMIPLDKVELQD